jgi:hypothetical protein
MKTNIREGEGVVIVWVKIVYTNHAQIGKREEKDMSLIKKTQRSSWLQKAETLQHE